MSDAIIGFGKVGQALATSSLRSGHEVTLSASNPDHAAEAARATGAHAAHSNTEAVEDAEIVIVAVPYDKLGDVFRGLGSAVDGKVVIDATNHIDLENPRAVLSELSNAEEIQKRHPKVRVVKAFNSVPMAWISDFSSSKPRTVLFISGDDADA